MIARPEAAAAPNPDPLPSSGERGRVITTRPVYGEREGPVAQRWVGEGQPRPSTQSSNGRSRSTAAAMKPGSRAKHSRM
jgi:hypothetical protein